MKRSLVASFALLATFAAADAHALPNNWGLLAPNAAPMKGVYFFVGDPPQATGSWPPAWQSPQDATKPWPFTLLPYSQAYLKWDGAGANQDAIVAEIASTHANVIVMSTWGLPKTNTTQGPMWADWPSSNDQLFDAVLRLPSSAGTLQIVPAIEGVKTPDELPGAVFPPTGDIYENWLYLQVQQLVFEYAAYPSDPRYPRVWAQMYDQTGKPRYVINLLHMTSLFDSSPSDFAAGLDAIANAIASVVNVSVGFTIDPYAVPYRSMYTPASADALTLKKAQSFLGIQAFNPEITDGACDPQNMSPSDPMLNVCPATDGAALNACNGTCTDQNRNPRNLANLIAWKRRFIQSWVEAGVPTFLDVSPGYDNRFAFDPTKNHVGLYGDNGVDGADDRFRNGESEMKRVYANGNTLQGIVYNAWNGFAEGLVGTWSCPQQNWSGPKTPSCWPMQTQRSWITDQLSVDPRFCDHRSYSYGVASNGHTFGDICNRWQALGAGAVYGEPVSGEYVTPAGNHATDFVHGGTLYWYASWASSPHPTYEVHGAINACYKRNNTDGPSPMFTPFWGPHPSLGLPTSDEIDPVLPWNPPPHSNFQNGTITYSNGVTTVCINGYGCKTC